MRNELGTTNREEPFKVQEIISMFDDEFVVLRNYGSRGRVRLVNTNLIIDPFYWEFQGMEARRVKRNVA